FHYISLLPMASSFVPPFVPPKGAARRRANGHIDIRGQSSRTSVQGGGGGQPPRRPNRQGPPVRSWCLAHSVITLPRLRCPAPDSSPPSQRGQTSCSAAGRSLGTAARLP